MNNENPTINHNDLNHRRKRIKHMKMCIVIFFIILLLLPTILSVLLFVKVNSLEKEIQVLKIIHNSEYKDLSDKLYSSNNASIIHAAEKEEDSETVNHKIEKSKGDSEIKSIVKDTHNIPIVNKKQVYLTFDDGPSIYTEKILDILKEYEIKATFFVVGKSDNYSKSMYQRIVGEGHTLGMHSYSHKYKNIYESIQSFEKDFNQLNDLIYEVTGIRSDLYRFPGGSSNQVSNGDMIQFIRFLNDKNITYFDWNVVNGDATGEVLTAEKLALNVLTSIKGRNVSVVLMHDSSTKINTVNSLPILIQELQKQEYNILPIEHDTVTVQHVIADFVK